jgi:hypothetical protein
MKLREMFEGEQPANSVKTIGVSFGRFNPPHKGHAGVWRDASKNPIWYVGTNESTSGPKDPLPYDVKLQCMAAVWSKVAGHVIPEQSLLTLASKIYDEHGENVHLKVYTDEEWLYKTLAQYNGVQGKQHGGYKFTQIDWAKTERLASATNLRAAVRAGDKKLFAKLALLFEVLAEISVVLFVDSSLFFIVDTIAPAPASINATISPTLTLSPSLTFKSVIEPFDGALTSSVTLSVSNSKIN